MIAILGAMCAIVLSVVGVLAVYQWWLAVAAMWPGRRPRRSPSPATRFLVLIPAHDEELGLRALLESLRGTRYPPELLRTVVIADRCQDATASVARDAGAECLERSEGVPGKGAAIAWAVAHVRASGAPFDAVLLVDADTVVHRDALLAFDRDLQEGREVQQGYNYLSNPWASPFTRLIAVTSILRNALFYGGKERLGLSSMLSGSGMCFSRRVIERLGWTAFSVGEDWEFSVALLLDGETIHFNADARVCAIESCGFRQASVQRLRWASGRHGVAGASTLKLLTAGLRERRFALWDAALTLVAPTYSVQATLALIALAASLPLSSHPRWSVLLPVAAAVVGLLTAYFALGVARTEAPGRTVTGVLLIPLFLPWRAAIEVLGLMGFGRKRWVRTARLSPSR